MYDLKKWINFLEKLSRVNDSCIVRASKVKEILNLDFILPICYIKTPVL